MEKTREPAIQVKNLYKIFRVGNEKVRALNGVDLTIYKGEFCAIVGTSGSGKSTMLNMLAGLEKPTKGEVIVAGEHLEKMNENQLVKFRREHVGFIFQSYNLLKTLNAVENVALPLSFRGMAKKERNAIAEKYLKLVGLEKQMYHMANAMSGGKQQRVGIAAAMLLNPKILMADEPTSALDVTVQKQVVEEMLMVRETFGTSIVLVTHNMGVIRAMADKVLVLHEGEIMEYGVTEEVFEHPGSVYTKKLLAAVPKLRR